MTDTAAPPRRDFGDYVRLYATPVMLSMLVLGFASGLPLMMVFQKLSFWMREVGIDRSTIGYFSWVTLAYSIKVIWSPVVDRAPIPYLTRTLGRRRSWMMLALVGIVTGLLLIGASDPAERLWMTFVGALVLAYSGATLDIAIDAWRIESAPTERQASMAAVYTLGYRFAIMFSGVGLIIADAVGWQAAFGLMAASMVACGVLVLWIREPPRTDSAVFAHRTFTGRAVAAVIEPFWQVSRRLGVWLIPVLALVAIYRLSDITMGVMASPLYADAGYSKSTVGTIQSIIGPWITIAGGFLGGVAALKFGVMRTMLIGAAITLATNAAFSFLAFATDADLKAMFRDLSGTLPMEAAADFMRIGAAASLADANTSLLLVTIGADNLAAGFVTTAFIAYLSSLTDPANAATQYALFSSLYALFCKFAAGFSGVITDAIGYEAFFFLTAAYAIPSAILVVFLIRFGSPASRGERSPSPAPA